MGFRTFLALLLFLSSLVFVESWRGNVCTVQKIRYDSRQTCRSRFIWCWSYTTVKVPVHYTDYICCHGWRDNNGDQNCIIPTCTPSCQNGGTCIAPNKCQCLQHNTGLFCDGSVCSHIAPCYPGRCTPPSSCDCTSGFTTTQSVQETCLKIEENRTADMKIYLMKARISYLPPGVTLQNESFWIMAESTSQEDMDFFWTNKKDFNRLETTCSSEFFMPDLPLKPDYIGNASFGVVSGQTEIWLSKRPDAPSATRFFSLNSTFPCNQPASSTEPVNGLYQCNLVITDFVPLLEHGDFNKYHPPIEPSCGIWFQFGEGKAAVKTKRDHPLYNMPPEYLKALKSHSSMMPKSVFTFMDSYHLQMYLEGGGFRELVDASTDPPILYKIQNYSTISNSLSVEFRFDFQPPTHCGETDSCSLGETMLGVLDITKVAPLRISWRGWEDADSGMYRYSMEVLKMTRTTDGKVEIPVDRTPRPLIRQEVFGVNNTLQEYRPPEAGMYSVILQASDRANNSKYVRRLCLYDPSSQITVDFSYKLYVTSASNAANYTYQSNLSDPIEITWSSYFRNAFHEENSLLGEVLAYPNVQENGDMIIIRDGPLDDHEGQRTVDAIPNLRGIVNFKLGHAKDQNGGENQTDAEAAPPSGWIDLGLNTTFTLPSSVTPSEADTVTVWVKATDAMGNEKIQRTQVTFDSTPPKAENLRFFMNVPNPGIDFSSTFDLTARDQQSGIAYILWTFRRSNGTIIYHEKVPGKKAQKELCDADITKCECTPDGHCFLLNQSYAVSNCHMMVENDSLKTETITVTATVTNMAGLVTTLSWSKRDITDLNGTNAYLPPQNVNISLITSDSVRITWAFPPSCFQRLGLWLIVNDKKVAVHEAAKEFSLTGLDADTSYTIYMVAGYEGGQMGDSSPMSFKTAEGAVPAGLTAGGIVGLFIGLLIIAALVTFIVLFVLWRKSKVLQREGPASRSMQRVSHVFDNIGRAVQRGPFANATYRADEDEIYVNSAMTFNSRQPWQYEDQFLTLLDQIAEGKFANIYKATLTGRNESVVAKMLKPGFSQDDSLKMTAKINFLATRLEEHENVLKFLGAVTDCEEWGPVMIMEYCKEGQLDLWLVSRRGKVDEVVIEKLFQFSLGIAKGMEYLASKQVVHNRLAARNILLSSDGEVKVAGLGPKTKESDEEAEQNARIPAKWAAPEVLTKKPSTEKSDVWSYGIVLWEIFSMGDVPYPGLHLTDIRTRLKGGYRMEKPEFADDLHYQMMKDCWQYKPNKRPTFHTIRATLTQQFSSRRADSGSSNQMTKL